MFVRLCGVRDGAMGIPKKALKKSQLKFLTDASAAVKDGSHEVCRVEFIEDGALKKAFYKAIDPTHNYPELLACISVASSHLLRSFQGDAAAEERLVFDDSERLIATLSIAFEDFKPLNCLGDAEPADATAKELAVPSTKTLIEKDFISVLMARLFFGDDDTHPRNVGFSKGIAVHIDYDMFAYFLTARGIKGERPVIGVPKKHCALSVRDWETFPRHPRDAMPYHWPTYRHPGELSLSTVPLPGTVLTFLPKAYADPTQFQLLANSPEAQEQKLVATLRILLTYQPQVMRQRLSAVFGERLLNYKSLGLVLSKKYEGEFPLWFNEDTNGKPFIDFMMTLYQDLYDNLYRIAVFYLGCENNGYGVSLPATKEALYKKPSLYKKIKEWVVAQNSVLYSSEEERGLAFRMDELERRYHQLWRDAFAPHLKMLLQDAMKLTHDVLEVAIARDVALVEVISEVKGKEVTDTTVTQSWHIFGAKPELTKEKIDACLGVDKDSPAYTALVQLVDFSQTLYDVIKQYYEVDGAKLSAEHNIQFIKAITALYNEYNEYKLVSSAARAASKFELSGALGTTSTYALTFRKIAARLHELGIQANFQAHLSSTDEHMKETAFSLGVKEIPPHTDKEIIKKFTQALFKWANTATGLKDLVTDIIVRHYEPYFSYVSARQRALPVKRFLELSEGESGANRIAYILGSDKDEGTGALNTALILRLAERVLIEHPIPSISEALRLGAFEKDVALFSREAALYARESKEFIHLAHSDGPALFYKTLFNWVDGLEPKNYRMLIRAALTTYESGLSSFRTLTTFFGVSAPSRRDEVEGFISESHGYTCSKSLALIFLKGEDTSALNSILFHMIVDAIQNELKTKKEKLSDPGYRLIAYYTEEHKEAYLKVMKHHSVAPSHIAPLGATKKVITDAAIVTAALG